MIKKQKLCKGCDQPILPKGTKHAHNCPVDFSHNTVVARARSARIRINLALSELNFLWKNAERKKDRERLEVAAACLYCSLSPIRAVIKGKYGKEKWEQG
jgi:hypothetical protein